MVKVFSIVFISFFLFSCDRLKDKGNQIKEVPQKVKKEAEGILDKVFPEFNAYEPDTKANKKRFANFLKVELTSDIKNIYCYDEAIGIDATYQFSFNCNLSTFKRIISINNLKLDSSSKTSGIGFSKEFDWWNKNKISTLELYYWSEGQYYKNFWYDSIEKKGYFLDYDM